MDLEDDFNLYGDQEQMEDEDSDRNENWSPINQDEADEEEQQFDIRLPASHSYMGGDLLGVSGRSVLEGGTTVQLPALAHHSAVFPGETIPMLLNNEHDAGIIQQAIAKNNLFGLLIPDETSSMLSGYGVVCDVYEVALGPPPGAAPTSVSFKARAVHRFRLKTINKRAMSVVLFGRLRYLEVTVLSEVTLPHPLRPVRTASLDARRRPDAPVSQHDIAVRRVDAAFTPWPRFVYDIFDLPRMRKIIHQYFQTLGLERTLPEDPVSLSFWVASNLTVAARDRLALFAVDNALLRLHMECRFIARKSVLCCATCTTEIARREHATGMSSDGPHGNYTNPGGIVHDVLTVSSARNTRPAGPPSTEFSWFPGYSWSVCRCACCSQHVGWRFDALQRTLRPRRFFALCRNYIVPRDATERFPPDTPPL